MEQDIRSASSAAADRLRDGRRGAAAPVRWPLGDAPRGGVGEPARARVLRGASASHRVVRYDRIGAGLSDRNLAGRRRSRQSSRRSLRCTPLPAVSRRRSSRAPAQGSRPRRMQAHSRNGYARSSSSGYVSRADIPEATRRSLVDFVRTNWPLAAQMLAGSSSRTGRGRDRGLEPLSTPFGRRSGRRCLPRPRSELGRATVSRAA